MTLFDLLDPQYDPTPPLTDAPSGAPVADLSRSGPLPCPDDDRPAYAPTGGAVAWIVVAMLGALCFGASYVASYVIAGGAL